MSCSAEVPSITTRLRNSTSELRQLQQLLVSGEGLDPRILTDFRDAVNRVRTTVWAAQQYAESKATETDPDTLLSVLAGERIRVAYQLCKLIQADLDNTKLRLQKGQLMQLHSVVRELADQLNVLVGE